MAILSYIGVTPVSVPLDNTAAARGLRVTRGSNGLYLAAGATIRGEYAMIRDAIALEVAPGAALGTPARVPLLTTVAVAVGDLAYSAAAGAVTNVSTNAAIVGRFAELTTGAALAAVDLFPVA